ncbi:MAG: DUF1223 domain-containing protein [Pseudolabrys sp.]|nr:DUF1223 domain-containing protein [Pseudolabrys sp.]
MNFSHITFAVALACAPLAASPPAVASEPRAVIELFTSQGCSSCPAADKLLAELASNDPSLLVMTLAIDYWDYLGWKDTLALHGHSKRQRGYAEARGDRKVYTPQVVVNGLSHVLGSDKAAIESAVAQTRRNASPLTVPVQVSVANGIVMVTVAAAAGQHRSGEVWLCPITNKVPVTIERGENRGNTVTYSNVVRRWVKLGDWDGTAKTFSATVASLASAKLTLEDVDRLAVLVQGGSPTKPGLMLGAATASLR